MTNETQTRQTEDKGLVYKLGIWESPQGMPVIEVKPHTWANMALDSVKALEHLGVYRTDLVYRTFSSDRMEQVLKYGTDRDEYSNMWEVRSQESPEDILWADSEKEKLVQASWLKYGHDKIWYNAVYDSRDLTYIGKTCRPAYRRNGAKPVAILKIDLNTLTDDMDALHEADRAYDKFIDEHASKVEVAA